MVLNWFEGHHDIRTTDKMTSYTFLLLVFSIVTNWQLHEREPKKRKGSAANRQLQRWHLEIEAIMCKSYICINGDVSGFQARTKRRNFSSFAEDEEAMIAP